MARPSGKSLIEMNKFNNKHKVPDDNDVERDLIEAAQAVEMEDSQINQDSALIKGKKRKRYSQKENSDKQATTPRVKKYKRRLELDEKDQAKFDYYSCIVSTIEEARDMINQFQDNTFSRYMKIQSLSKNYSNITDEFGHRVINDAFFRDIRSLRWNHLDFFHRLPYDGMPYVVVNEKTYNCDRGPTHRDSKRAGVRFFRYTKKTGCHARIVVREVIKFPKFSIPYERRCTLSYKHMWQMFKKDVNDGMPLFWVREIMCTFPSDPMHNHPNGPESTRFFPPHPLIRRMITDLVRQGVRSYTEIRPLLNQFIFTELFPDINHRPSFNDCRYFVPGRTLRGIMWYEKNRLSGKPISEDRLQCDDDPSAIVPSEREEAGDFLSDFGGVRLTPRAEANMLLGYLEGYMKTMDDARLITDFLPILRSIVTGFGTSEKTALLERIQSNLEI